jgi:subtilisin family serine protease
MIRRGRAWVGLVVGLGLGCQGPTDDLDGGEGAGGSDWRAAARSADQRAGVAAGGRQTVWLMLRQQADLGAARGMRDWRARGQMVFERLRGVASQSQGPLREILRSQGIDHQAFWIVNALRITADPALVRLLGQLPEVASVHPDRTVSLPPRLEGSEEAKARPIQWGLENIGAPAVWDKFGFRGQGIVVASIDTGVDFEHPALRRQYRGTRPDGTFDHNYSWYDPARVCGNPSPAPCDNAGHGTHTMGIIVGDEEDELAPNHIGVAPRARWIAAKGCESGDCSLASLMRAGEWMVAPTDLNGANPRPDMRPHIVNNSWSAGAGDDVFFRNIVKAWVAAGIFPAFASGNDGPGCSSADSPADYSESYAVGAYDSSNQIASFSSRGNTSLGGVKPNISAPGVNIRSSIPGGLYGVSNGTSMATPHVSGTIALLWSAAPSLLGDVAATRALLDQTAIDTEDLSCGGTAQNNNVFGEGRLDAFAAVNLAPRAPTGKLEGMIRASVDGHTLALPTARLRAQGPADRTTAVDASGAFGLVLPAGRYTVTASAFGFLPETVGEVVVVDEESTVSNFVLQPAPTHAVRGVIRQTDGRPLAGARVLLEGTPLLAAVTDSAGAYTLTGVPPGAYQLSASRGGCFSRTSLPISVDGGDAEMDLALPRRSDYYGYFCEPRRAGFIDANQVLPLTGDRGTIAVPLPFGFSFYGRVYHQAEIASAGYLSFIAPPRAGGAAVRRIPEIESPNAAIYAFWDDLMIDEGASVRTELVGTAPQRAFVVEWRNVAFRDAPDLRVRFEIVLHEDGRILTQYLTAGPDRRQRGALATVGLEDADGGDGLEYSSDDPSLDSGAALLYALPPSGVLQGQVIDANDGRPLEGVQLLAWNEATGSRTTFTDQEGRYRLELRVGLQALGIYGPSYGEETRAVTVAEGDSLRLDVALRSGRPTVAPAALDFPAGDVRWQRFTLTNTGSRELSYDIASADPDGSEAGSPWLSARPASGVLAPGAQQSIEVFVDAANLPAGEHRGQFLVWTDTPATQLFVPVSLTVPPPPPARPHRLPPAFLGGLRTPAPAQHKRGWNALSAPRIEASAVTSSDGR